MTAHQTDATTDPQSIIAALRAERDAALAREAALAEALTTRNSEYGERIEQQSATIDVLKVMSASPGDPQPVFDLIARQAAKLCNVPTAAVATFDGTMIYLATQSGFDAAYADAYVSQFPRPVGLDLLNEFKETAAPGFAALTDDQRAEIEDVSAMLTSNLEKITEHGKRADGIVKAMLEHSRGSSTERRMVDLNVVIDEALSLAYHGARAQDQSFDITLERDFGEGIAPIEVNPQDMTRVFLNIFGNGFYATTRRARSVGDAGVVPTLKVTTRDASEMAEIRVRDNGTGIPADSKYPPAEPGAL
jgi:hypothetical protein